MDTNSLQKIQTAHPYERDNMLACYHEIVAETPANVHIVVNQVWRSVDESNVLWKQGRNAAGVVINQADVVSNAKGGQSWHNWGLAWDITMVRNGEEVIFGTGNNAAAVAKALADKDYVLVIKIMAKYGYTWGGNFTGKFKDVPHFENKHGQTLTGLMVLYNKKQFIAGTIYVDFKA